MASITVRNLDEDLKRRLRIRAAENGRSMEQEAREILRAALSGDEASGATTLERPSTNCSSRIGGVDPFIPPREPMRDPPRFD